MIENRDKWPGTRQTGSVFLNNANLAFSEELVNPSELIKRAIPGIPASSDHLIYKIDGETPVYIPALLLIRSLYMGDKRLNRAVLMPNGIDLLAQRVGEAENPKIVFRRNVYQNPSGHIVRTIAWLLSSHTARLSHASVLAAAREGRIALRNAEVMLTGWVRGIDLDGVGLLAYALGSAQLNYPVPYEEILVQVGSKEYVHQARVPINPSPWSSMYDVIYADQK
jgi:hypothetical protein